MTDRSPAIHVAEGDVIYFDDCEIVVGERLPNNPERVRVIRDGVDTRVHIQHFDALAADARTVTITRPGADLVVTPPWRSRA